VTCGDSLYLTSRLPDGSVGAVVSDPPFFCGIGRDEGGLGSDPWEDKVSDSSSAVTWARPHAVQFKRILRKGGAAVVMAGVHATAAWMVTMEEAGFIWMSELMVLWNSGKPRIRNFGSLCTHVLWFAAPGARHTWNSERKAIYSNILVCDKVPQVEKVHPAQKPVELTTFLISLLSKQGDVILDPFCGSGSTLVSAAIVGRPYIGFDRDKEQCTIARARARNWELESEGEIALWVNGRLEEL
jgi:site-specific DNA-methyltransferase (adenine-specific)